MSGATPSASRYARLSVLWRPSTSSAEIQSIVAEINAGDQSPHIYSREAANALKGNGFDRIAPGARGLAYERLDQLTVDLLLGAR